MDSFHHCSLLIYITNGIRICSNCRSAMSYTDREVADVAKKLSKNLSWGKDKQLIAQAKLLESLRTGCVYCKSRLFITDIVFDHKEPIGAYRRAGGAIKKHLDRPENIHGICRPCNDLKGDMSHEEFTRLTSFLNNNLTIRAKIERRLMQSRSFYKLHKKKTGGK